MMSGIQISTTLFVMTYTTDTWEENITMDGLRDACVTSG